jgi:hypothetical protein
MGRAGGESPSAPATWPGFATRLVELVTESWDNAFRLETAARCGRQVEALHGVRHLPVSLELDEPR